MPGKSADRATRRARLIELIKSRSFQEGPEFKLASGKTSTFYFNMKPTMLDSEGAYLVASLILDQLEGTDVDLIGGLEMGAVPIASSVAAVAFTEGRKLPAFFVRKQVKEHGTQALVEGLAKGESMAGKKIVVVEDVTTTGGSALKAADALKAAGADIVRVITIVDRLDGAAETFATAGLNFEPLLTLADFKK
ncbi:MULTISPECIES: orotate phosphoribosyltransferase [unclassified Hyphomicrobium]|uniref:orotate phosphoribosyltransferase n=1 Tax=unclassified Hyphomicrobium TaxID=2619925 RepID=UPI000213DA6A|nr:MULTISPECIES: orotate phosphoribosyltransferase [unclassified Hyphomicrobium]CCB63804.1 Orotate phosphoribosyltransferase [Hyphomicrobium sp. MC1]